jgi:hypothetical protein
MILRKYRMVLKILYNHGHQSSNSFRLASPKASILGAFFYFFKTFIQAFKYSTFLIVLNHYISYNGKTDIMVIIDFG